MSKCVTVSQYTYVVVDVSLSDIDTDDLLEELESRDVPLPDGIDMDRISHLLTCGLIDQAQKESWEMILKVVNI